MALIWKRLYDTSGLHEDGSGRKEIYYRAGAYRIDPQLAWNARSYDPRPNRWVAHFDPTVTMYGGTNIGTGRSLREAKRIAQEHADALERAALDSSGSDQ